MWVGPLAPRGCVCQPLGYPSIRAGIKSNMTQTRGCFRGRSDIWSLTIEACLHIY